MNLSQLLAAMIAVESGGNDAAIGDHGRAHGALQIHACVIQDVNCYTGSRYTLRDAHDRDKAIRIASAYLSLWANERRLGHPPTAFELAATFHAGPGGTKKPHALRYWRKVKQHIK